MRKQNKGSVTIYLSLILAVLLSLLLTLLDGARRNTVRVQADCAMELATYSIFAEYNRALYDRYHLLFVDTSYQKSRGSEANVVHHMEEFIKMNLSEGQKQMLQADFTKTYLQDCKINQLSYATDEQAAVYERQAVLYMEHKYGLAYVQAMTNELKKAESMQLFSRNISAERSANQSIIEQEKQKGKETGEIDENGNPITEPFELDNPADQVSETSPSGILLFVLSRNAMVSAKKVSLENCYSNYVNDELSRQGSGLAGRKELTAAEILLFSQYIRQVCGCYTNQRTEEALNYQMEYIIAGNDGDEENLKQVVYQLLFMREVSNVTYLFQDMAKQTEAETLATTICTSAGVPYLIEPVKLSLLFAWGYAESIVDVKNLLKGKRVPIIKEAKDWHLSLSGMLTYATQDGEEEIADMATKADASSGSITDGLSYEDYLMLLILSKTQSQRRNRMIDLTELNVRNQKGNENFNMSNCIDALSSTAVIGSKYGYDVIVERSYCYQ